ncbi:MAG: hypothetical protein LAT63_08280 [Marinobacter sp.]|nr:hypothetical protein [Marinobacter sp.]
MAMEFSLKQRVKQWAERWDALNRLLAERALPGHRRAKVSALQLDGKATAAGQGAVAADSAGTVKKTEKNAETI